jgi:hypothetical protein
VRPLLADSTGGPLGPADGAATWVLVRAGGICWPAALGSLRAAAMRRSRTGMGYERRGLRWTSRIAQLRNEPTPF